MSSSMHTLVKAGIISTAGLVGGGLMALGVSSAAADDAGYNRYDDDTEIVTTVDDDDDDDTRDRTRSRDTATRNSINSRASRDATNSRFSKVSRDKDRSRGDLTRDMTGDGPGKQKRDWSAGSTNDNSRNDTRRR